MSQEPTFPAEAAVATGGDGAIGGSETLNLAASAKQTKERIAEAERKHGRNKHLIRGAAAVGVGSAALVAALLYANRSRRSDPTAPILLPPPSTED